MLRRRHFAQTQTARKTKRRQKAHEARRPGRHSARSLPRSPQSSVLLRRRVASQISFAIHAIDHVAARCRLTALIASLLFCLFKEFACASLRYISLNRASSSAISSLRIFSHTAKNEKCDHLLPLLFESACDRSRRFIPTPEVAMPTYTTS